MSAFTDACDDIMAAATFKDISPYGDPDVYKELMKVVHPDKAPDEYKAAATGATARLSVLWDEHNGKPVGASGPVTITTKKRTYVLGDDVIAGTIANLYPVSWNDGDIHHGVLKMPRSPRDTDLMEREAKALKALDKADSDYRHFASMLVETFRHKDATTKELRRANVFEPLEGFYSLAEVADAYPNGVDPRDVAWMWRRLFVAIGLAADNGIVHGAVVPDHVMIHPTMHGVVLTDWCYSCMDDDQTIPAIVPGRRAFYPQSVIDKEPPTYAVDVAMAAKTMVWLCGSLAPRQYRAFAQGCAVSSPPKPAELLGEFDELISNLYGPRKYRLFNMPPV